MLSRSKRQFLEPEKDRLNPNVYPGRYTKDEWVSPLVKGKNDAKVSHAPFNSLQPRVTPFDEIVAQAPPPGSYEVDSSAKALYKTGTKVPIFSRSKVERFSDKEDTQEGQAPAPGSYSIPRAFDQNSHRSRGIGKHFVDVPLNVEPVPLKQLLQTYGTGPSDTVIMKTLDVDGLVTMEIPPEHQDPLHGKSDIDGKKMQKDLKKILEESKAVTVTGGKGTSSKGAKTGKIVWKRKFVPPSIPSGVMANGYKEKNGELLPRGMPQKKNEEISPFSHLVSFAEESKKLNKGFKFDSRVTRQLEFSKNSETPAPGAYDPLNTLQYLAEPVAPVKKNEHVSPLQRLTDKVIHDAQKMNLPGPGSYQMKSSFDSLDSRKGKGTSSFASKPADRASSFMGQKDSEGPPPGNYNPKNGAFSDPFRVKSRALAPFGNGSKRFIYHQERDVKAGPGSYRVEEVNSMIHDLKKKTSIGVRKGVNLAPFGGHTERFKAKSTRANDTPAPGYSQTDAPLPAGKSPAPAPKRNPMRPKYQPIAQPHLEVKDNASGFNVSADRFNQKNHQLPPPPTAYDVVKAFEAIESRGKVPIKSAMCSSRSKGIFDANRDAASKPGPAEYDPIILDKKEIRRNPVGAFLSTDKRFVQEHVEKHPEPGSYNPKFMGPKSFNVTFDDTKKKPSQQQQQPVEVVRV